MKDPIKMALLIGATLAGVVIAVGVVSAQVGPPQGGPPTQVGRGGIVDEPPGGAAVARPPLLSPPARTAVTIDGKKIEIRYSAPSMRKRVIFGGLVPYRKVWRAGANDATALHTDAELSIGGLTVPKGDYTLFVWPEEQQWHLIVNRQTGQTGLQYDQKMDFGRVPMALSKPPKTIGKYKMTLSKIGPNEGELQLAWENTVASVRFEVRSSQH